MNTIEERLKELEYKFKKMDHQLQQLNQRIRQLEYILSMNSPSTSYQFIAYRH